MGNMEFKRVSPVPLSQNFHFFKRPFKIIISNITAEAYSSKCRVNASVVDGSIIREINIELLTTVRNPFIYVKLYFESDNGKYDMELLNRTVDLCKFYKDKRYEPIVQVVFNIFYDISGHWIKRCPLSAVNQCDNVSETIVMRENSLQGVYYQKNIELNVEKLPPIFPEKSGTLNIVQLEGQERMYGFQLYFQIVKTYQKV